MGVHKGLVVICCVCRRVRSRTGRWYRRMLSPAATFTHTYCPRCAAEARKSLADWQTAPVK